MDTAATIKNLRMRRAGPEVEASELLSKAARIAAAWGNPRVRARAELQASTKEAAERCMSSLRDLGYTANFIINGDYNDFAFALAPEDAPSFDEAFDAMFP